MKKTAQYILNEMCKEKDIQLSGWEYDCIVDAMNWHSSQSHPAPTEAEINEAAQDIALSERFNELRYSDRLHIKEAILQFNSWFQSYQTQESEKPNENINFNLLSEEKAESFWLSLKERAFSSDEMKLCYQRGFEDAIEHQASQPNPAIAVIEALEAARAELYQFVPITDASVLHKLTEAINSLKQIKV